MHDCVCAMSIWQSIQPNPAHLNGLPQQRYILLCALWQCCVPLDKTEKHVRVFVHHCSQAGASDFRSLPAAFQA